MKLALYAASVLTLTASAASALEPLPANVGIVEKLGETVPGDLTFTDENGRRVKLADYLNDGKPILLTMVYYKCAMLCSLTLNGVVSALRQQSWQVGKEFRVITVSFDDKEKPEVAAQKQRGYLSALQLGDDRRKDWPFLTGDKQNIDALADAVGFKFRWDDVNKTWDHTAALIALAPDGKVTRYLYGVQYPPRDIKLALFESANGRVGTTMERALLRCYAYDANTKSYRVFAVRFVRAGSLLVLGLLVTFLTILWRRDMRRSRAS
ncbi:MAG: SCO1/SenC family protein [Myxococcales bacterium]|nr:SCO1/SenC family protein [Myxococcales bacterium]